ncbi:hypothetical protein QYZ88_007755 [Lachnospiraceae bacterium C1.1]|nr:hypothetical protein [Lachnospiraceae bacterium C1.1]
MGYTVKKIREICAEEINKPEKFYNIDPVNYRGMTVDKDKKRYYTEVIAEFLSEEKNLKRIKGIEEHNRKETKESYNMNHSGEYPDKKGRTDKEFHSNEKIIAIDLFNQCKEEGPFDFIGRIVDYQTPLKAKQKDSFGEIDLLSVNDEKRKVYILELKKNKKDTNDSPETMLKCILEAYTYYKLVKKEDLLRDFELYDYDVNDIVISPLVFREDKQYEEWNELCKGKRPQLRKLIDLLDVEVIPFFLDSLGDNKYRVLQD